MNLYNKHRPRTFSEVLGNTTIIDTLEKLIKNKDQRPGAFLFTGPTGCGKTTLARIITRELECAEMDIREIDSADFRGIDTVRQIRQQAAYHAIQGDVKVFIIDECHKMTNDAQNALLKTLEDIPSNTYFILCTTDPQKLIPTIKSRCSQFQVNPLSDSDMLRLLMRICRKERQEVDREVFDQIIMDSFGLPRNAINILEQVLAVEPEQQIQTARQSAERQSESIQLCRALIKHDSWKQIRTILDGLKNEDPETIRRHILAYCTSVLLKGDEFRAGEIMIEMIDPFYNSGFSGLVFACYTIVKSK
jgi:DNA polymerase-3 subunit gamma/tau